MSDRIAGHLAVGINPKTAEVVVTYHNIETDTHIVFSPDQARMLAESLKNEAEEADTIRLNALPPAVHALWNGMPLCRFTNRLPCNWPDGHFWLEPGAGDVTCAGCRAASKSVRGE